MPPDHERIRQSYSQRFTFFDSMRSLNGEPWLGLLDPRARRAATTEDMIAALRAAAEAYDMWCLHDMPESVAAQAVHALMRLIAQDLADRDEEALRGHLEEGPDWPLGFEVALAARHLDAEAARELIAGSVGANHDEGPFEPTYPLALHRLDLALQRVHGDPDAARALLETLIEEEGMLSQREALLAIVSDAAGLRLRETWRTRCWGS